MEFKLYRTRLKLSSLLAASASTTQNSFLVLTGSSSKYSLWFNRSNGDVQFRTIQNCQDLEEISTVYGYIGKFQINVNTSPKLIFIKQIDTIGQLRAKAIEHSVYKIKKILIISLTPGSDDTESLSTIECDLTNIQDETPSSNDSLESITIKKSPSNIALTELNNVTTVKFERKITDEIYKIFQDNDGSFYFSPTFDLTNTIERQEEQMQQKLLNDSKWRNADDYFFWNKILLSDLINTNEPGLDQFIIPLIQGFVGIETFANFLPSLQTNNVNSLDKLLELKMCLISRRNRYRLGTRFKRRGVDDNGNVANYVETEQIIDVYDGHTLSFVIIRGSIPIYWSQPGLKYRPAPQIDKNYNENKSAFEKHFTQLNQKYSNQQQIIVINLVEEFGRESLLGDAFIEQISELNSPKTTYVQFDFHEYCKGLNYNNISILTEKIKEFITDKFYCWVDNKGFIFKQKTLFRINCVDCLDRTNVIQTVISKIALENQLARLGFFIPPVQLPSELNKRVSILWADNGDAISQQYAGTAALKGDFTRTGERNIFHALSDGMKSANRYVLRFKENYRQLAFDVLQGVKVTEDSLNIKQNQKVDDITQQDEISQAEREENVRQLIADCKKLLVDNSNEDCYGSWGLINYTESSDPNQIDPDVFLLFTSNAIYISNYDDSNETFIDYQKILLKDVEKLELAPESNKFFKFSNTQTTKFYALRLYYKILEHTGDDVSINEPETGYFHTFRSCNLRFFNNLVITTNSNDQLTESLRGICHTIQSTASHFNHEILYEETVKLTKRKSKTAHNFIRLSRFSTRVSIDLDLRKQEVQRNSLFKKMNKLFASNNNIKIIKAEHIAQQQDVAALDLSDGVCQLNLLSTKSSDNYVPKLNQKNFANNRDLKLSYGSKYVVNESKTKFIII